MDGKRNKKVIATHDKRFHADDVFAVAALTVLEEGGVRVVRTRDEEVISSADYVVDVGGEYDADKNRFDHHQKEGAGERKNGIPYASFGLVWKHFGKELCGSAEAAEEVDELLVQSVDASDNGVPLCIPQIKGVSSYSITKAIRVMNEVDEKEYDRAFETAVDFAKVILQKEVETAKRHVEDKKLCKVAYESADDKRLIILDRAASTKSLAEFPEPLFAVWPGHGDAWVVRAISFSNSRKLRKKLPESWAGKREEELAEITGVGDAQFAHRGLHFATAGSKEGAVELAKLALDN